jgi:hypothetical protein
MIGNPEWKRSSLIISADLGQLYYFAREYDAAEAQCKKVVEMDPNFLGAHIYLDRDIPASGETRRVTAGGPDRATVGGPAAAKPSD